MTKEVLRTRREFELTVHVEGADLKDIVEWLRQATDLLEEGYKEMNTEVESAAGSFFVEVLEPEEDSEEKINDETSQE